MWFYKRYFVLFVVCHALLIADFGLCLKFISWPIDPGVTVGQNVSLVWNYVASPSELSTVEIRWGLSKDRTSIFDILVVQDTNGVRKVNKNINPRYKGRVAVTGNATLQIYNVTEEDDGWYGCQLNSYFDSPIKLAHLKVYAPPVFLKKSPSLIEGIEGNGLELLCQAKGIPIPQLEWTKEHEILTSGRGISNLLLDPLKRDDGGRYVCRAGNRVSDIQYTVDLVVLYRPTKTRLESNAKGNILSEGETLKLSCKSEANPPPAYMIYHKSPRTGKEKLLTNSSRGEVVLGNISPTQSGTYICIPYNKVNNGAQVQLFINVKYPPRFSTKPPATKDVLKGVSLDLRCEAMGYPKPSLQWIHKKSGRIESNSSLLYFEKVGLKNDGEYICSAKNGLPPDAATEMRLNVLYKPEIQSYKTKFESWIGKKVELPCKATGNPPPYYRWKKHGLFMPNADGKNILTVIPDGPDDFGLYTCNASNSYGVAELTITVYEVKNPSKPIVTIENEGPTSVTMNVFVLNDGGSQLLHYTINHNTTEAGWGVDTVLINDNNIYKIKGLQPYTAYKLRVTAYNKFFSSQPETKTVRTEEWYPGVPSKIKGIAVNSTTLRIQWAKPQFPNGQITNYEVKYGYSSNYPKLSEVAKVPGNQNNYTIMKLTPNAKMSFQVKAYTKVGPGNFSSVITATTEHSAPSEPINPHVKKTSSQSVTLSWGIPETLNGIVAQFKIQIRWRDMSQKFSEFKTVTRAVRARVTKRATRSANNIGIVVVKKLIPYRLVDVNDLRPFSEYEFRVQEGTGNSKDKILWGPFSVKVTAKTPETAPSRPQDLDAEPISQTSLLVTWSRPDFPNGKIRKYSIEYSNRTGVKYFADVSSGLDNTTLVYLLKGLAKRSTYSLRVKAYTVKPGIPSKLVQVQTGGGGDIGAMANDPRKASNPAMPIFVGVLAGIVAFAFIVIILGLIVKKRRALKEARLHAAKPGMISSDSGIVDKESVGTATEYNHPLDHHFSKTIEGPMSPGGFRQGKPIPVAELREYCIRNHTSNNKGFIDEFRALVNNNNFTWEHSKKNENKSKNRYQNVMAYDHTRVVLSEHEGSAGSDYINANYIDGYQHPNKFVATQGPVAATFNDFWRMAWEQKTPIIVMITNIIEKGRIKCQKYWPTAEPEQYGAITVTPLEELELADYTIRKFALQLTAPSMKYPTREITQYHFTSWPDHGVPTHATGLLAFLRRVRNSIPENSGPIITHCSAGVGRTGTFIVLDAMFDQIIAEGVVDIFGFVNHIRTQRNLMVQSELQYMFMYDALLEAITCGNTEIPVHELRDRIKSLNQIDPETGQTQMAQEFKNLDMDPDEVKDSFTSAHMPENKPKNRNLEVVPYESSRVKLWPYPGVKGSDYINASFIDGYQQREAYLATQAPLEDTTEDFWRMTWEYESYVVVMLSMPTEGAEPQYPVYWPDKEEEFVVFGLLMVEIASVEELNGFIRREFKLTNTKSGEVRTVFHFWFTEWPKDRVPDSSIPLIDMISQVTRAQQVTGNGSISVHCADGSGRTGAFCAISICIERLKLEGTVDMFQTVRSLRSQRPGMVQTLEQYRFCYNTVMQFVDNFTEFNNFK